MISVPASALRGNAYFGSVFDASRLKDLALTPDLRLAVDVVASNHNGSKALQCVARPEMFTHGRSLEWLRSALPGVTDHLALSDGHTLKLIPGLKNHVFLYGLQTEERRLAFRNLLRRVPELWPQYESQVNSHHSSSVPAVAMLRATPATSSILWFYPLYLNRHSIEDSVNHVLGWGEPENRRLDKFSAVTYVPLTECACKDPGFQRVVADTVLRAYFDSSGCLLIRLPLPEAELAQRVYLALESINAGAEHLPRVRPTNIFLVANDIPERTLAAVAARLTLILHLSVEFWCYTGALYAAAAQVRTTLERGLENPLALTQGLHLEAFGRLPDVIRPPYRTDDELWTALL